MHRETCWFTTCVCLRPSHWALGEIQRCRVIKAALQAVAQPVCLFPCLFPSLQPEPHHAWDEGESWESETGNEGIKNQNSVRFSWLQTVLKLTNMHDTIPPPDKLRTHCRSLLHRGTLWAVREVHTPSASWVSLMGPGLVHSHIYICIHPQYEHM